MALGVDYTTGFGFINVAGAGATQPILLNSRGGNVGVNSTNPSYGLDVNGTFRAVNAATFNSNVTLTGGASSYLSNSGNLSNAGLATFYSNVQIIQTGASLAPYLSMSNYTYGSFVLGMAGGSGQYALNTLAGDVILCASNSGNTTERMFITNNSCNNLVLSNGYVGVNCNAPAYTLDVNGIARSAIPVSSITGTYATFGANSFGIYYYITNSAFSNIALYNTSGGATGTSGTAPPVGTGWYITLRNNTGSYLSITVNGILTSTPASPFVIPPSNATTLVYDSSVSSYIFF
jgi:hypothetical protein